MHLPPYAAPINRGRYRRVASKGVALSREAITISTLPSDCVRSGAAGYTDTKCYGVVQICTDKCRVYDPIHGDPSQGYTREVSGTPYPCGVCFGLPF
jgi:hypothetical protein